MAAKCKADVRRGSAGHSFAGIADSNPAGSMEVCLLWMSCVVTYSFSHRADYRNRFYITHSNFNANRTIDIKVNRSVHIS